MEMPVIRATPLVIGTMPFKIRGSEISSFAPLVPPLRVLVGESGIVTPADVARLETAGVRAILVGESLMRQSDVAGATRALLTRERAEAAE